MPNKKPEAPCKIKGCTDAVWVRGVCMKHYQALRRAGTLSQFADKPYAMGIGRPPEGGYGTGR